MFVHLLLWCHAGSYASMQLSEFQPNGSMQAKYYVLLRNGRMRAASYWFSWCSMMHYMQQKIALMAMVLLFGADYFRGDTRGLLQLENIRPGIKRELWVLKPWEGHQTVDPKKRLFQIVLIFSAFENKRKIRYTLRKEVNNNSTKRLIALSISNIISHAFHLNLNVLFP